MIINKQNYQYTLWPGLSDFEESLTIPDQSLTLREIMERHTRGIPPPGGNLEPQFAPDRDTFDISLADYADRETYLLAVNERARELRRRSRSSEEAAKLAAIEAEKRERSESKKAEEAATDAK